MIYAPLVMPEVITGLSLLLLFVAIGLDRGLLDVVTLRTRHLHACATSPWWCRRGSSTLRPRAGGGGAWTSAATPLRRLFLTVTLPLIAPAVAAGLLLAFTLSLDDLVIASFTSGPGATTLPMRIYSQVRLGVTPEINAASTLLIALVTIGVIAATLATKRSRLGSRGRLLSRKRWRASTARASAGTRGCAAAERWRARGYSERLSCHPRGR